MPAFVTYLKFSNTAWIPDWILFINIVLYCYRFLVDGAIIKLQNWASAKKAQMVNGESARINAEREKAYASAGIPKIFNKNFIIHFLF